MLSPHSQNLSYKEIYIQNIKFGLLLCGIDLLKQKRQKITYNLARVLC